MPRIRKDVASLGAGWSDELLWYARAIIALSARAPDDRTSWRYLGAIHGFDEDMWIERGVIDAADPLPAQGEQAAIWNQCQHQGWYFLPWHRGYLAAFEAIVAAAIEELGGPEDWGLPYWNYLDATNPDARHMPSAFLDAATPDGDPNPLSAPPRDGTNVLGPQPWFPRDISLGAMAVTRYTSAAGGLGFGGGRTGFNQFGGRTGAMEADPHNIVHVLIGGVTDPGGYMSDPNFAGLDPIFWLHHCNVDRLWEAWLTVSGNVQENGNDWRNGPFPRRFEMPQPDGSLAVFTPADTLPGGALAPTYDNLTAGTDVDTAGLAEDSSMPATFSAEPPPDARLAGASAESLTIEPQGTATTSVALPAEDAALGGEDESTILNLENIRGAPSSGVLNIYVSAAPAGAGLASEEEHVESVALFGLAKASAPDGSHGGNGISVAIDITDLANRLARDAEDVLARLDIRVEQPGEGSHPITVGRVSVYKQPVA